MMDQDTKREYKISAIKDFLAVPFESIDACLADLKAWIEIAHHSKEFDSKVNELIDMPGALAFVDDAFTWIDDGISGCVHVEILSGPDDTPIGRISFLEAD
jgi:hypothetical protein